MKPFRMVWVFIGLVCMQPTLLRANEATLQTVPASARDATDARSQAPKKTTASRPRAATTGTPIPRERLNAQRALEAKRHARAVAAVQTDTPMAQSAQMLSVPRSNARLQVKPPAARLDPPIGRDPYEYTLPRPQREILIAPTSIDAHVMQNLREPLTPEPVEVGDRPARGTSLCSEGKVRRFGDLDSRTLASNLPDFNIVRPRTLCVRKRSLIADYAFR